VAVFRRAIALNAHHPDAHGNLLVTLNYDPASTVESLSQEARRWAERYAQPLRRFIPTHANNRDPGRRLRIGYLSADFWEHASAFFLMPLLTGHDHQNFEIFCYAHVTQPDYLTRRMQALADHWRNIAGLDDEAVAAMIHVDEIDILVDLKLHTANNRLLIFARKPAPVQATWLGYPGSTGLSTIDYRLSDSYLDPPGMDESVYTEKTVRLPDSFWCYDPLFACDIPCNAPPALVNGYVTFGCMNNFCKVNDVVLRLWAKVLHTVPASRLLMLAPVVAARPQVLKVLEQEGIAPQRVEFAPHQHRRLYLQTYQRIDLGLDTFPYNGHTTTQDSFWMGVPMVTLVGQTAVGRAGLSLLSNIGLPELAAHSEGEYVRIASELAGDLPRLSHLRATLRQRMQQSPLMDGGRFARNMEAAYRQMWRQWCARPAGAP
jgi:predicted O-linked N-acetylglucosamine transferase (SPINDLY family)